MEICEGLQGAARALCKENSDNVSFNKSRGARKEGRLGLAIQDYFAIPSSLYAYQWCALPTTPEAWWGIGGKLTYPNGTSLHTWGIKLCTIPLHIPYTHKYPISPCRAQCVTGRYGYLWNSQRIFQ